MELVDKERLKNRFREAAGLCLCDWLYLSEIIREIDKEPIITLPTNKPLTLDELRKMEGEPVCIYSYYNGCRRWKVVHRVIPEGVFFTDGTMSRASSYGNAWLPYRRKPEEGTTCQE